MQRLGNFCIKFTSIKCHKNQFRASPLVIHIERQMGKLNFTGILHGIKGPEDSICITLHVPFASVKCSYLVCTMIPFFWDITLCHRVNGSCFPAKCHIVIALWHSIILQNIIPKTHNFLHHFTNSFAGTRTQKLIPQFYNGHNPEPLPFTSFPHKFPQRPISLIK
jgi:hypothetical protein